jgi:hypothetical protein
MSGIAEMILELLPEPGPVEFRVAELALDMPVEVAPQLDEHDRLQLTAGPPSQLFRTSVMPVLHRISLRAELVEEP